MLKSIRFDRHDRNGLHRLHIWPSGGDHSRSGRDCFLFVRGNQPALVHNVGDDSPHKTGKPARSKAGPDRSVPSRPVWAHRQDITARHTGASQYGASRFSKNCLSNGSELAEPLAYCADRAHRRDENPLIAPNHFRHYRQAGCLISAAAFHRSPNNGEVQVPELANDEPVENFPDDAEASIDRKRRSYRMSTPWQSDERPKQSHRCYRWPMNMPEPR